MPGFLYWCWEYKQVLMPVWQALTHWDIFLAKWQVFKYWKCNSLRWSLFSLPSLSPPPSPSLSLSLSLYPLPPSTPSSDTHSPLCGGGFLPGVLRMPLAPFSKSLSKSLLVKWLQWHYLLILSLGISENLLSVQCFFGVSMLRYSSTTDCSVEIGWI